MNISLLFQRCFTGLLLLVLLSACQTSPKQQDLDSSTDDSLQTLVNPDEKKIQDVTNADQAIKNARIAWKAGKTDLAQALYIAGFNLEPKNVNIISEMADLYRQLNKFDLVAECYRLILEQQPNNLKVLELSGLLQIKQKQLNKAKSTLTRVIENDKTRWQAYNGLGIVADMQNKHSDAQIFFRLAINKKPDNPEILNNLGYSYYMDGIIEFAKDYFVQALQIDPAFKKALYNYALLVAREKQYEEAVSLFAKAISLPEAHNNTGYIAMMNRDFLQARQYLDKAMELSPRFYRKAHENLLQLDKIQKQVFEK